MYEMLSHLYTTEYFRFVLTLVLSFLTGLEMREYKRSLNNPYFIGTVRTYTLIGVLGYILYILDPSYRFYLSGLAVLSLLFALFYHHKLQNGQKGIISLLSALLVYTYAPIIITQPLWFTALIFVSIVFIVNAKTHIQSLLETVDNSELITFSKLVLLSVVIWPLLPTSEISPWIPVSLSKIWLAMVIVSGISYIGYILQRYFFKEKGFILNGILGGIYSSTATTIVLSRQSKDIDDYEYTFISAIVFATGMMYLRLIAIIGFLNFELMKKLFLPLIVLSLIALLMGYAISKIKTEQKPDASEAVQNHINPLELEVALLFAAMFVVMTLLTHYFITYYGTSGLNILSLVIGFTDIDPFILSLVNGSYPIDTSAVISAILIAIASNNLFKGMGALMLGSRKVGWRSLAALGILAAMTFVAAWIM
ncbi:MAG: MgtC/SapB family protein [Sulfuricurvum sp.]|uniref:MgtC/SapB family protein n=2 Tax=Sulfuricurvum sp. TaxID=2025608 RepID=UPI00261D92D3|nr:DUF4010 domain-containing protein [Sulfuricurvum sp.]MDD2838548.1 DUF4010 domain-containing protein [Sulfuricurvum sp.]MDD3596703.1 DUF4010 domain-containing protein [Sulfuricurvum sp.]MDD4884704.1 DUF4010 domain-containing protein [Sulfuricurvum sp.]